MSLCGVALVLFLLIEYAHLPIHGALWADMGDHFVPKTSK